MKYKTLILGLITATLYGCGFEGGTLKSMQEDFDKIRLDHVFVINSLVQEYKTTTGKYPFETDPAQLPAVVIIQTEKQKETHKGNVPIFLDLETRATNGQIPNQPQRVDMRTVQEFEKMLSDGLKRKIVLPKDHQKVPVNKPSVYIYTYYLGVYDVTAFLHNDFPFARNIGSFYNKLTVGNRSAPDAGIWKVEDLTKQDAFRMFFLSKFNRGGYELKTQLP